jgi:VWFA-related protein
MTNSATARRSLSLAAAAAAALLGGLASAQDQPATTFRSSIDVVRVDVSVLDSRGRPVEGLSAADFSLSVDGKPRKVLTADYVAASLPQARPAATPPSPHYSTNEDSAGGRLILFVIDQGTIQPARARETTAAAERFVARLNPSDRVALVAIPGLEQVDFTANHALIRAQLRRIAGLAPPAIGRRQIGVAEAYAIMQGDPRAIEAATSRECRGLMTEFERRACRQEVITNASIVYSETRGRSQNTLGSLRALLLRLAQLPEPKTVIVISGGLILDRDYSLISWFGPLAARAQATFYSIFILGPYFEASVREVPIHYREDMMLSEEGLEYIANLGRGSIFRLTTDPQPIFNRLATEISAYYLLGFEPEAADRDERVHKIKVEVSGRDGVSVHARPEFTATPAAVKTVEDVLADTIRAPLLATDIRLKATTYTFREPDSQKLRLVIGAEIERTRDAAGRLSLGLALFDQRGNMVASHVQPDVSTRVNPRTGAHQYFNAVSVDEPGVYTLKIAAVDDLRRRGSVEHTFRAELAHVGPLHSGDLMLAETGADSSGDAEPVISADYTSAVIHTFVELYADGPDPLRNAAVSFEIADDETGAAITSVAGTPVRGRTEKRNVRALQGAMPVGLLPPGDYVARAVVTAGGRKAGEVRRPFRVARPSVAVSGAPGRTPPMLPSRLDGFDRQAVLNGDVVGFFLDRMAARNARGSAAALAHARGGQFDALLDELKTPGGDALAAAFLSGLGLYARGELEPAARRFRDALKIDSEFFPAAFYLGACYAAGGRDREAANAWQTSLVSEGDAPFIYPLIADAMLRARDPKGAVETLKEAVGLWPDNETLQVRLGVAYAMAGEAGAAIRALDPYLARHPEDHDKLFLVLRAIYEARNAGRSVATPEQDRETFARYAAAYAAAGGPHQALVDRWKKFLQGR